jgi:hypothetical protein
MATRQPQDGHEIVTIPYAGRAQVEAARTIRRGSAPVGTTCTSRAPGIALTLYRGHQPVLITTPVQVLEPNRGERSSVLVERERPDGARVHEPAA